MVEIGTGAGMSGLALFAGMRPDGILTSVDVEADHQRQARKSFLSVGIPPRRFRLISGAALTVLPKLSDGAYDLVFVDGDELDYADYVEQGLRLLRHGGLLVLNDALRDDHVADPGQRRRRDRSRPRGPDLGHRQRGPRPRPPARRQRPPRRRQTLSALDGALSRRRSPTPSAASAFRLGGRRVQFSLPNRTVKPGSAHVLTTVLPNERPGPLSAHIFTPTGGKTY